MPLTIHEPRGWFCSGVQYYNHSKPWISHVSLQGHDVQQLDMAKAVWTRVTPKPIVWDEVRRLCARIWPPFPLHTACWFDASFSGCFACNCLRR